MKGIFLTIMAGLLTVGLLDTPALAGEVKPIPMTLHVVVTVPPPCTVKGSNVEFGDVIIKRINGINYRMDAGYTLDCTSSRANDVRMQLKGDTTTVNGETVLSTGISGFGIRIENGANNSLFALGESNWLPFNINNKPSLKAVPVKESGAQLTAAEFNATMTMVVDYQ
ncbi:fimbrial protein [Pseudocitrobacter corydidari]